MRMLQSHLGAAGALPRPDGRPFSESCHSHVPRQGVGIPHFVSIAESFDQVYRPLVVKIGNLRPEDLFEVLCQMSAIRLILETSHIRHYSAFD